MANNIYGNDAEPKIPFPSKIKDVLFEGVGVKKPAEDDPLYQNFSDVFETSLGKSYDITSPFKYPTQARGINTEALYHQLFINIGALMGSIPGNESIGNILRTIQSKLENDIDPNILLNIIAKIIGPGIYNNGLNGAVINFTNTSTVAEFIITGIDAIIMQNKVAIYKNIGNQNISVKFSEKATPNTSIFYRYAFVVKNIGELAFDFVKALPTSNVLEDVENVYSLFLIEEKDLLASKDSYMKFVTEGEIVELFQFRIDTGSTSQLIDFKATPLFTIQTANVFHINQLKEAISGNAVTLEFPKDMVEEINEDPNDSDNYDSKKMGEVFYVDTDLFPDFALNNPVIELSVDPRELTADEKLKYGKYVTIVGNSIPGDAVQKRINDLETELSERIDDIVASINKLASEWGGGIIR